MNSYQLSEAQDIPQTTNVILVKPVIKGELAGLFADPSPACQSGGATCTGIGTDSVSFGAGGTSSELEFTGAQFDTPIEQVFKLGQLRFKNGTFFSGLLSEINLKIATGTTNNSAADDLALNLRIAITNTPNTGTPEQNADYISFIDYPDIGTFHVIEGKETEIPLYGRFGSFDFVGIGEPVDLAAGFVSGQVVVPLPPAIWLFGSGLLGLIGVARRKRKIEH